MHIVETVSCYKWICIVMLKMRVKSSCPSVLELPRFPRETYKPTVPLILLKFSRGRAGEPLTLSFQFPSVCYPQEKIMSSAHSFKVYQSFLYGICFFSFSEQFWVISTLTAKRYCTLKYGNDRRYDHYLEAFPSLNLLKFQKGRKPIFIVCLVVDSTVLMVGRQQKDLESDLTISSPQCENKRFACELRSPCRVPSGLPVPPSPSRAVLPVTP